MSVRTKTVKRAVLVCDGCGAENIEHSDQGSPEANLRALVKHYNTFCRTLKSDPRVGPKGQWRCHRCR